MTLPVATPPLDYASSGVRPRVSPGWLVWEILPDLIGAVVCLAGAAVGNVILPPLVKVHFPDRVPLVSSLYGAALMAGAAAWVLPAEPVSDGAPVAGRERFRGLGRLAADPGFMIAIFAVGCVQAAHAFYYGFSAIAWKAQGIPENMTGLLWAFSVVVEIAFMWWAEPWRRAKGIGPWTVLGLGSAAAMVRWTALAFAPPLWMLWPLQTLHALTFAATYLAGVQLVEQLSPPGSQTAAQTLSSVLSAGVLIGLATLAAGPLYDAWGVGGYLAMTGLAAMGGLAALTARRARAPAT